MNLDEFLKKCAHQASNLRCDEWQDEGAAMEKLVDLVRKLREQRDEIANDLWIERGDGWLGPDHTQEIAQFNAALDEIVRGG